MDEKLVVYTDGSYRDGVHGTCFHYLNDKNNITIIYGNGKSKTSLEAELKAIIRALEYFISKKGTGFKLEIRTDCNITEIMSHKLYKKWDLKNWRKKKGKGRIITCCPNEIFYIRFLVEHIGVDNVSFVRVRSWEDCGNRLADKYCNHARKILGSQENQFYEVEVSRDCNRVENTENAKLIEIDISNLGFNDIQKPWKKPLLLPQPKKKQQKATKWFSEEMKNSIVYINSSLIALDEDIHLKTKDINFNGMLRKVAKEGELKVPIVVRQISENNYALVFNMRNYLIAKALNIEKVPCIITELNHLEFAESCNVS